MQAPASPQKMRDEMKETNKKNAHVKVLLKEGSPL